MVCSSESTISNLAFFPLEVKSDDILILWVELAPLSPRAQMAARTSLSIWPRNGKLEDTEIERKLQMREAGMAARHRSTSSASRFHSTCKEKRCEAQGGFIVSNTLPKSTQLQGNFSCSCCCYCMSGAAKCHNQVLKFIT